MINDKGEYREPSDSELAGLLGDQRDQLVVCLRKLVDDIDTWNQEVGKLIRRQIGYSWTSLEEARKLLEEFE